MSATFHRPPAWGEDARRGCGTYLANPLRSNGYACCCYPELSELCSLARERSLIIIVVIMTLFSVCALVLLLSSSYVVYYCWWNCNCVCFNVHRKSIYVCVWGGGVLRHHASVLWCGHFKALWARFVLGEKGKWRSRKVFHFLLLAWCVAIALCKALYAFITSSSSSFSGPPWSGRETLTDYTAAQKRLSGRGGRHYSVLQLKTTTKDD